MSAAKETRNKIKSVQNTQKITRAMQMVATSKMRRTQERMRACRPYANNIRRVIANLARINPHARGSTPFLRDPSSISKVGIILITSDKGLCGSLNSSVIKLFCEEVNRFVKANIQVQVCALGHKGLVAVNRLGLNVISSAVALGDLPQMYKLVGPVSPILNGFHDGELDAVYVVYSNFVNTMKQQPVIEQLLPITTKTLTMDKGLKTTDYIYEPEAEQVLDDLVRRYVESVVYQCLADNMASEQAARMVAMKSATDNAGNAINQLKLVYNKSRQALITKELAEIVAGSAAV